MVNRRLLAVGEARAKIWKELRIVHTHGCYLRDTKLAPPSTAVDRESLLKEIFTVMTTAQ